MALAYTRLIRTPVLTNHSRVRLAEDHADVPQVCRRSLRVHQRSDRDPGLPYLATVYNGIDTVALSVGSPGEPGWRSWDACIRTRGCTWPSSRARCGSACWWRGLCRIRPTSSRCGPTWTTSEPRRGGENELFSRPRRAAPEHHPERFGLVMAEANCAGVPVVAMDLGSCREVIADGERGSGA